MNSVWEWIVEAWGNQKIDLICPKCQEHVVSEPGDMYAWCPACRSWGLVRQYGSVGTLSCM